MCGRMSVSKGSTCVCWVPEEQWTGTVRSRTRRCPAHLPLGGHVDHTGDHRRPETGEGIMCGRGRWGVWAFLLPPSPPPGQSYEVTGTCWTFRPNNAQLIIPAWTWIPCSPQQPSGHTSTEILKYKCCCSYQVKAALSTKGIINITKRRSPAAVNTAAANPNCCG